MQESQFTIRYKGQLGSLRLRSDDHLVLDTSSSSNTLSCSSCTPNPSSLSIKFDSIIVVSHEGVYLQLWYCKTNLTDKRRISKKIIKVEYVEFETEEKVANLVGVLRRQCCWWGRSVPPHVLVVINPVSGQGKAVQQAQKQFLPTLVGAGIVHDVHVTSKAGDAIQFLKNSDLKGYDAIAVCGGDGTIHEILQGILDRPDWQTTSQIPILQVPGGSGNGLACSQGAWDLDTAAYILIKGRTQQLDILSIIQPNKQRYFSFYGVQYGLMTNLDIGTENLRWMGDARFTLGALREILRGKRYRARILFKKYQETNGVENGSEEKLSGEGPYLRLFEGVGKVIQGGIQVDEMLLGWTDLGAQQWQLIFAGAVPWIARDFEFLPSMKLDSGYAQLITIKDTTRIQGISVLQAAEKGTHLDLEYVKTSNISAMLIIPMLEAGQNTWMSVDGEVVDLVPLYMEVHPRLCRAFVASDQLPIIHMDKKIDNQL